MRSDRPGSEGTAPLTCLVCGQEMPPPGARCPHCKAWRPDVARDRALYTLFTLLALAAMLLLWTLNTPGGGSLLRPGLWREFLSPFVVVPLALAVVFAVRLIRKTRSLWWR